MTKNVGRYTIDLYETYINCKELNILLVFRGIHNLKGNMWRFEEMV